LSTQEQIAGLSHSNTEKRFRYTLLTKDDPSLTMYHAPEGWETGELTFIRDPLYKGVIESYSTDSLKFVKEAKNFIQTAYERGGIDYEITIYIDILNNSFSYQRYFTGKLDLSTYEINSINVSCEVIPSGFQNVVLNRDDIKVDLFNTKFIGGGDRAMPQISGVPITTIIPTYDAIANADWRFVDNITLTPGTVSHWSGMDINATEFESTEAISQDINLFVGNAPENFFLSLIDRTVLLVGNVTMIFQSFSVATDFNMTLKLYKNDSIIQSWSDSALAVHGVTFSFDVDESIILLANDVLRLAVESTAIVSYNISYSTSALSMSESVGDTLPASSVRSFPVFEFVTRILQLYSGEVYPLESTLLGRTDSEPTSYGADGEFSLITFTNGLLIRLFDVSQVTFNASLKDAFKTLNGILNIGLGFEDGKVVIENEKYFYDIEDNPDYPVTDTEKYTTNQILDLSTWLNDEVISKAVLPEWYANEIKVGYNSFEYENIQGLKEFNTKSNYVTPLKSIKRLLDLVSPFRFDTQGVNKLRAKPQNAFGTEDVSGDNDVFGFDVKRATVFEVKTDDDFILVSGGIDPAQSYNLNFTPRRNLERHGNRISSMRFAAGDEIQWMKSDKNTKLVTQKTGEVEKPENEDLLVNDLDAGYWMPEAYQVEAPIDEDTVTALQLNSRGVVKIGTDKYGWLLECQTNNENKKGSFKLLRVNLQNVKVIV